MFAPEPGTKTEHIGWRLPCALSAGERLDVSDVFQDASGSLWSVYRVTSQTPSSAEVTFMAVLANGGADFNDTVKTPPPAGVYLCLTRVSAATIHAAVEWWVARLRGDKDLTDVLHEHDTVAPMGPKAQGILGAVQKRWGQTPVAPEKLSAFAADLRQWLQKRYLHNYNQPNAGIADLKTDYEPCWEPMVSLARKHGINGHRFPWKTSMVVFRDRVVVNGRVVFGP